MKFALFKNKNAVSKEMKESRLGQVGKSAMRDWEIMLVLFVIINLAIGGIAAYFFNKVSAGALFQSEEVYTEAPEIDVALLKKIVERFETKKADFESMKATTSAQIDPAL